MHLLFSVEDITTARNVQRGERGLSTRKGFQAWEPQHPPPLSLPLPLAVVPLAMPAVVLLLALHVVLVVLVVLLALLVLLVPT